MTNQAMTTEVHCRPESKALAQREWAWKPRPRLQENLARQVAAVQSQLIGHLINAHSNHARSACQRQHMHTFRGGKRLRAELHQKPPRQPLPLLLSYLREHLPQAARGARACNLAANTTTSHTCMSLAASVIASNSILGRAHIDACACRHVEPIEACSRLL